MTATDPVLDAELDLDPGGPTARRPSLRLSGRVAWQLLRREPVAYLISWLGWVVFFSVPIGVGLLLRAVLDRVAADPAGGWPVWALVAALGGIEVGRWSLLLAAAVQWHGCWVGWHTIPRLNLLRSLVSDPGPAADRLPGSPGEAVSRFRDDVQDLAMVLDVWLDFSGAVVASSAALVIMFRIDARTTVVVALPVVAILLVCHWLTPRLRAWRRTAREGTAAVTGFIGDTFGSITAVKAAGAEVAVERRFAALGHARAKAARRDEVGTHLVYTLSGATANAGVGITMLLIAPAIRRGEFTVGDLGLFTTYITVLATLPRWAGRLGAYHRQADVSVERLAELLPGGAPGRPPVPDGALPDRPPAEGVAADQRLVHDQIVAPVRTSLRRGPGTFPATPVGAPADRVGRDRLRRVDLDGLTVRFPSGGGVSGIDLTISRGSLTVVTGPVGAGKSTLLRAVLGLIPTDAGTVSWNGQIVPDPSLFLVPPRAAYVPQVPRLFSEPLSDTILLGVDPAGLAQAIHVACLDEDLAEMPSGGSTVVGPKGIRLSGGQIQRAAAARAFVRRAELLVVDDLSSALDVETEAQLWDRVLSTTAGSTTVLVVSHRPRILERADQVLVLDAGLAV
jgi:ATP-binding cassette subfamily B protein